MVKKHLVLFVFISFFLFSSHASQLEQSLKILKENIASKLHELNSQYITMETQLTSLSNLSATQQKEWEEQLQNLNNSLNDTILKLNSCYQDINSLNNTVEQKDTKIKNLLILAIALIIAHILAIAGKVALYILNAKGIKTPKWVDIII